MVLSISLRILVIMPQIIQWTVYLYFTLVRAIWTINAIYICGELSLEELCTFCSGHFLMKGLREIIWIFWPRVCQTCKLRLCRLSSRQIKWMRKSTTESSFHVRHWYYLYNIFLFAEIDGKKETYLRELKIMFILCYQAQFPTETFSSDILPALVL